MNRNYKSPRAQTPTAACALLIALFVTLSLASSAAAENWTIGFAVGTSDLDGGEAGLDFRSEVRGAYYFHQRFAVEGQFARANGILDDALDTLMINGIYELRPGKAFAPYLLAGVGAARFEDTHFLNRESSTSRDGAAWQAALGARYYFGEAKRMGMQVELSRLEEQTDSSGSEGYTSLTAGMTWKLGR